MSDILDQYKNSTSPIVTAARNIPANPVNFLDVTHQFQTGFIVNEQPMGAGQFTDAALDYYDTELKNISTPSTFVPTAQGETLNEYNYANPYNAGNNIPG